MARLRAFASAGSLATLGLGAAALWAASRPRPVPAVPSAPEPPPGLPPARVVHVPGRGEFFVRETGDPQAPPLVLLHGWMFPADLNWSTCYEPLGRNWRVIAPDFR